MSEVLGEADRTLLSRLSGLPGYKKATQQELASELGVTQQAISKQAKKAIAALEKANWQAIFRWRGEEDFDDYL